MITNDEQIDERPNYLEANGRTPDALLNVRLFRNSEGLCIGIVS